jgi:hypothetical protein
MAVVAPESVAEPLLALLERLHTPN